MSPVLFVRGFISITKEGHFEEYRVSAGVWDRANNGQPCSFTLHGRYFVEVAFWLGKSEVLMVKQGMKEGWKQKVLRYEGIRKVKSLLWPRENSIVG